MGKATDKPIIEHQNWFKPNIFKTAATAQKIIPVTIQYRQPSPCGSSDIVASRTGFAPPRCLAAAALLELKIALRQLKID
jgi:hypothetical protein